MQSILVEIGDLAGKPGASKQIQACVAFERLGGPLAWVEKGDSVDLALEATSVKEGLAISGRLRGRLHLNCSRCLADFEQGLEREVDETFYFDPERAADTEGYVIHEMKINLEPMLRDVIVLGMPMNPLHKSDCLGLCALCGADLNAGDCGHDRKPADLRWAPLQDILPKTQEN
ncbi:MAG: YceD family protein [Actinomycetota bacterium]